MIVICWWQLPIYAARCIGAFVKQTTEDIVVFRVQTSRFPIRGAAEMTGTRVIDVAEDETRTLAEILGETPSTIVCGGWHPAIYWTWLKEVKRAGGRSIFCTDEPYRGRGLKEWIRNIRFQVCFRRWIDYVFVAGEGGRKKFVDFYKIPANRVVSGVYSGDPELFYDGEPLCNRAKKFVYVGHYDENKNVIALCKAFAQTKNQDWSLELYGGGPLAETLKQYESERIKVNGYINADQLGEVYRSARCFVLGSFSEQWGVVVHEACMCGCLLLLSDRVGARFDFATLENAALFNPASVDDLRNAFEAIMAKTNEEFELGRECSLTLGKAFTPTQFAERLSSII